MHPPRYQSSANSAPVCGRNGPVGSCELAGTEQQFLLVKRGHVFEGSSPRRV